MSKPRDIREAAEAELRFDPLIDDSDITLKNLNGDVALNGTVPSYSQYRAAAAAAHRVAGVRYVSNHLAVELPAGDYQDDAQLTTAANNALIWDVTVPDGVDAVTVDGSLTLCGIVSSGSQCIAAERAVAGLTGVRNVRDQIVIRRDADPVDVTALVQGALDRHALFVDDSDVTVSTAGSTVMLGGHVRTWAEHCAAVGAAWMASGVDDVVDDMDVTG